MKHPEKGLHLHFDPLSGIAGDMTVAALVDAGVPRVAITEAIAAMNVPGLRVAFEPRTRGAYAGTGFVVFDPEVAPTKKRAKSATKRRRGAKAQKRPTKAPRARGDDHGHDHDDSDHGHDHDHDAHGHLHDHGHDHDDADHDYHNHDHGHDHNDVDHDHDHGHGAHVHRDYAEIKRLLRRSGLDADVKALAGEIFAQIAEAESVLHGVSVDRIGFHEVGAYDSIADIVGASAAIAWLAPSAVSSSAPVLGTGRVRTAHGPLPVPAPATALLLTGIPTLAEGAGELTTPTGAAILATVVDNFGPPPPLTLVSQGFGAGTRELADRANVLRVLLGQPVGQALTPSAADVVEVEANIDDMNPQLVEPLFAALLAAGAVDVWATPILMKKGRPALTVSALTLAGGLGPVTRAFFENSSTIGVRTAPRGRHVLSRSAAEVMTPFGAIAVKVSADGDGRVLSATPEFDDCRRIATSARVPVRAVLTAAAAAAASLVAAPLRSGGVTSRALPPKSTRKRRIIKRAKKR